METTDTARTAEQMPPQALDLPARLAGAAELDDPERVRLLDEIYATLEAELERESPGL